MALRLAFGHSADGNATVKMETDALGMIDFDYVVLVKWLFENKDKSIDVEIADYYSPEQQTRIKEHIQKIEMAAKDDPALETAEELS